MNEIMLALEAMVTRITREEINARGLLERGNPLTLSLAWREAMRVNPDMYMEVQAACVPTNSSANMTTEMFGTLFIQFMNDAPNAFKEVVKNAVLDQGWFDAAIKAEVAESSSSVDENRIKDLIMAAAIDGDFVSSDGLKETVRDCIHDTDHDYFAFNNAVQSVVRDMDFSVSVDR